MPKRGWTCVDLTDLKEGADPSEELDFTCEMCEQREIRHVHHMQHPAYDHVLKCGCVCAGKMEGNPAAAKERERVARNAANRRKGQDARRKKLVAREWARSAKKGNEHADYRGYHVTIIERTGGWSGLITRESDGFKKWATKLHPTAEQAKDLATRLIDKREDG